MDTHIYLLSTIPTAVLTASGSRVSSQPLVKPIGTPLFLCRFSTLQHLEQREQN